MKSHAWLCEPLGPPMHIAVAQRLRCKKPFGIGGDF